MAGLAQGSHGLVSPEALMASYHPKLSWPPTVYLGSSHGCALSSLSWPSLSFPAGLPVASPHWEDPRSSR